MSFIRNCPQCGKEIHYKHSKDCNQAKKSNKTCKSCSQIGKTINRKNLSLSINCLRCGKEHLFKSKRWYDNFLKKDCLCKSCFYQEKFFGEYIRNCPQCNKEIKYKDKNNVNFAEKNNILCCQCTNKNSMTNIKKEKISVSSQGKNNPMYGKSFYDIWKEKHGEQIANQKLNQFKIKAKNNSLGKNNPMYGKPAPQGSGNGWSGYYKNYYFRSLLELSYLKYLLDNNIKFENGEKKKYCIEYQFNNVDRTYRPDYFLVETQELIEIKPKNLINSQINKIKFEAGRQKYGNKFKVLTEDNLIKLNFDEIYILYKTKDLIFDKKYDIKFKQIYDIKGE